MQQMFISPGRREAECDWQIKLAPGYHVLDLLADAGDHPVVLLLLEVLRHDDQSEMSPQMIQDQNHPLNVMYLHE